MWRVQCGGGGVSVRTYAYDKCNIDLGQYRAEYLPSRLQYARTHTINVILTSYKGNTGQVFAGIALVLGQYYIRTLAESNASCMAKWLVTLHVKHEVPSSTTALVTGSKPVMHVTRCGPCACNDMRRHPQSTG